MSKRIVVLVAAILICRGQLLPASQQYQSHRPMRPLPSPSSPKQALVIPSKFVHPSQGDDNSDGSKAKPWKTLAHAVTHIKPGETLYLRGGTYFESVTIALKGTASKRITICDFPGELPIIDAGHREFFESPATAWEPVKGGAKGEYRSTRTYKRGGNFGNFGDSMIPFQRYLYVNDLRSTNELWHSGLSNRRDDPKGIYAGPGVRRDPKTGRIHIRLAHTKLAGLKDRRYRGETDPRKLPLIIAGADYGLRIEKAEYVRIQGIVVRGAGRSAVSVVDSKGIHLDGVTLYGSGSALRTQRVDGFKITDSFLRGHAAPWHSRGHHKDRAPSGYLVIAGGKNLEFAHCELTDHHDGILLKDAYDVKLHHSRLDNFNDDGIEPGPKKTHGVMLIYQNVITRCLSPFTAHGKFTEVKAKPGSGVYLFRNIVDLRGGTYKSIPRKPDPTGAFLNHPTTILAHDHGSPTWPVAYIYHNTFLMSAKPWRGYYGLTWGSHLRGTSRRVFNNIFVQVEGVPAANYSSIKPETDFRADGNLHWGMKEGGKPAVETFGKFRRTKLFTISKTNYKPGWTMNDVVANPKFVKYDADPTKPSDFRVSKKSPAINAGVPIPKKWPDPCRSQDADQPDIGALPHGVKMWPVGAHRPQ